MTTERVDRRMAAANTGSALAPVRANACMTFNVMAGLVPAIHVFTAERKAWMAVTSTAMTL